MLESWAAVAPGLTLSSAWQDWAQQPNLPQGALEMDLGFIPALQKRRLSLPCKMALDVAHRACPPELRAQVALVFTSRHGELATAEENLHSIQMGEMVSPTKMVHSVHNTAAGLCSLQFGNQKGSKTLAAGDQSFQAGWWEAWGHLVQLGGKVLLVQVDPKPQGFFAPLVADPGCDHALALLLSLEGTGQRLTLSNEGEIPPAASPLPQALDFLRWLLAGPGVLALAGHSPLWLKKE